jgi:hypothetical protein
MPTICDDVSEENVPRFSLGEVFVTSEALKRIQRGEMLRALEVHASGGWEKSAKDQIEVALSKGLDIQSGHVSGESIRFCILTKADRSSTIIFLPDH